MSNETRIKGKSYTGIEVEASYGTAPSPDVTFPADAVITYGFEVQRKTTDLPRDLDTPYDASILGASGLEEVTFSFETELTGLEVDDSSSAPNNIKVLQMCGFSAMSGYDAGPPKTIYTELMSGGFNSYSMIHRQEDVRTGNGEQWTLRGCRADGTLKLTRNQRVMLGVSGRAKTGVRSNYSAARPALTYADTEGATRLPLVTKGVAVTFETVGGGSTYGGCFIEGEIALNRGLTATECAESSTGVGEVLLVARGPITGSFLVKDVPVADFDFWSHQAAQTDLKMTLAYPNQDDSLGTTTIEVYLRITGVEEVEDNGQHALQLAWAGLFPSPSREDNSFAGVTPANNLRITWSQAAA